MAVPTGVVMPGYTYGETNTIERSVVDKMEIVSKKTAPLLKTISPNMDNLSLPCEEVKFEWTRDELNPRTLQVDGTTAYASGDTTLYVASGQGEYLDVGQIIKAGDAYIRVTAVGSRASDLVTVTTHGGTTGAVAAVDANIELVGRANMESQSAWTGQYTTPSLPYNLVQTFVYLISASEAQQAIARYGINDWLDYQSGKKMIEAMRDFELQMFHGWRTAATAGSVPRSMGGFPDTTMGFIYYSATDAESHHKDLGTAVDLTEKVIIDGLQLIHDDVGDEDMATLIVCNGWNKRQITSFYAPSARMDRGSREGGVVIDTVDTEFGPIDVMLNHLCPTDEVLILNPDKLKVGPLKGLGWHTDELGITDLSRKFLLHGEYTFMNGNDKAHYRIYDTSTS